MVAVRIVESKGSCVFLTVPILKMSCGNFADTSAVCNDVPSGIDYFIHFPVWGCSVQKAFALREVLALRPLSSAGNVQSCESCAKLGTSATM